MKGTGSRKRERWQGQKGSLLGLCGSRELGKGSEAESGTIRYGLTGRQSVVWRPGTAVANQGEKVGILKRCGVWRGEALC